MALRSSKAHFRPIVGFLFHILGAIAAFVYLVPLVSGFGLTYVLQSDVRCLHFRAYKSACKHLSVQFLSQVPSILKSPTKPRKPNFGWMFTCEKNTKTRCGRGFPDIEDS